MADFIWWFTFILMWLMLATGITLANRHRRRMKQPLRTRIDHAVSWLVTDTEGVVIIYYTREDDDGPVLADLSVSVYPALGPGAVTRLMTHAAERMPKEN